MKKTREPMTVDEIRPLLIGRNMSVMARETNVSRHALLRIRDRPGYQPTYGTRALITGYLERAK